MRFVCLGLLAGCLQAPSYDGTEFRCVASDACPQGYHCSAGVCRADRPFAVTSPWNTPAVGTVDARSDLMIANLGESFAAAGHGFNIAGADEYPNYGVPIFDADETTPHSPVADSYGYWSGLASAPIPADASITSPAQTDTEGYLVVWSATERTIYEFWDLRTTTTGLSAGIGVTFEPDGAGYQSSAWALGARTYGGSLIAGAIRYHEMERGVIEHALAIGYPHVRGMKYARGLGVDGVTQNIASHSQRSSQSNLNTDANIPLGARLRLKASVDVDTRCGNNRACRVLGVALQRYGAYMVEPIGDPELYVEVRAGRAPVWGDLLHLSDAAVFAAADFEVLALPAQLTDPP